MTAFDTRPGVLLAVLVVTWVVITLLVLVIANLNSRLRSLERRPNRAPERGGGSPDRPYAGLLGRNLRELTGEPATRALLILSVSCRSCRTLLAELNDRKPADPALPITMAWADGRPGGPPPPGVTTLEQGARISAELGVRVTPFALVADEDGTVTWAGPVSAPSALLARLGPKPTARTH